MERLTELSIQNASQQARTALLQLRSPEGVWTGELSASALSTATAVVALALAEKHAESHDARFEGLIERGLAWLAAHSNADGGWGDTVLSASNLSTTTLVWAALGVRRETHTGRPEAIAQAEKWLIQHAGTIDAGRLATQIIARYGSDRTFSVPILTHCALAGRLGTGREAWNDVIPLPFELAACPPSWFAAMRLPVVSYALPALIAIGYARHFHAPSRNPLARALRTLVSDRVFRVLDSIQPSNGGFLEAIPLTSFVVMSLAGSGKAAHPVARRGLEFIVNSAQPDGSWRIDTNLATWVTTLGINALDSGGGLPWNEVERSSIHRWLMAQQHRVRHPYTNAAPGGWSWTPLPGGVPDADDTAGALLALKALGAPFAEVSGAATSGATWLLDVQNRDGGIPTFCRGWGTLPFDRSSADLTAHALRAWGAWQPLLPDSLQARIAAATRCAVAFLRRTQEAEGAWNPLWFGNQFEPDESNRVYGTSRVLLALADTGLAIESAVRAAGWLARAQKPDGGWAGGLAEAPPTVEETALATEALSAAIERSAELRAELEPAIRRGVSWLIDRLQAGRWTTPAPIGFYFAKLWYFERLYPMVFTVAALGRAARVLKDPITAIFPRQAGSGTIADR